MSFTVLIKKVIELQCGAVVMGDGILKFSNFSTMFSKILKLSNFAG